MKLHSQTMAGLGEPCALSLFVVDLRGDETTLRTTFEETNDRRQSKAATRFLYVRLYFGDITRLKT